MHIIFGVEGTISLTSRWPMYGYDYFSSGNMVNTYIRDGIVPFMRLCIDKGHKISLWSDGDRERAADVARYITREYGLEFEILLDDRDKIMGRKCVSVANGDLIFDDDPENNYVMYDPYVIVPRLSETTMEDTYFYDLMSRFESVDNWEPLDFM